jgi:hypothetical protein
LIKGGKSTFANGWKNYKVAMVSLDGTMNCSNLMHTLLKSTPLNVLMFMCDIVWWRWKKNCSYFQKQFGKLKPEL